MVAMVSTSNILGYRVANVPLPEIVDLAGGLLANGGEPIVFACANPHTLTLARSDPALQAALRNTTILVPDGMGLVLAGRLLRCSFAERVTGPDFFEAFSARLNAQGNRSYYFLGTTEEVLARLVARLSREYPRIAVAGTYAPPFRETLDGPENEEICERINAAKPDVLWVGMSSGKQEKWVEANRGRLQARFIGAVGAAFDFYAESVRRAPRLFREAQLEWLYRLSFEPQRLWRRSVVSAPAFAYQVCRQHVFARPAAGVHR